MDRTSDPVRNRPIGLLERNRRRVGLIGLSKEPSGSALRVTSDRYRGFTKSGDVMGRAVDANDADPTDHEE